MAWNLTKPALQYDQLPNVDPNDIMGNPYAPGAIPPASILRFFKNPALRTQQFAQDAMRSVQPARSTVEGQIPPDVAVGRDYTAPVPGGIGPEQDPNYQFAPADSSQGMTVGTSQPQLSPLPKFMQPSFREATTDQSGLPRPINASETKLGKLLHLGLFIGQGMAAGAGQPNFGAGFAAAQARPYQLAQERQQVEAGGLENQARRANLAFLPLHFAIQRAQMARDRAASKRASFQTPSGGGVFNTDTNQWAVRPNPQKDSAVEQRQSFADEHADVFKDANEQRNFVLYGHEPKIAKTNPNEWQLRIAAANGDEDAQAVLDQRFREQKTLAGIRGSNRTNNAGDAASAEQIASKILNNAGGDPDRAMRLFDERSGQVTDPEQRRLGPAIRKAIRARKRINKPQSAIDRILSGDIEGGLGEMQQRPQ
jgi:hypothetical protein